MKQIISNVTDYYEQLPLALSSEKLNRVFPPMPTLNQELESAQSYRGVSVGDAVKEFCDSTR